MASPRRSRSTRAEPTRWPAIETFNAEHEEDIEIRQIKYINNIVEQDHRSVNRVAPPALGFKSFRSAAATLAVIELMHMDPQGPVAGDRQVASQRAVLFAGGVNQFVVLGLFRPQRKFAPCVDARFGARKIFWIAMARSRVLTCVRPHECSGSHAAGPYGSSRIGSKSEPRAFKHSVANWFSRSHLTDYCAILSV